MRRLSLVLGLLAIVAIALSVWFSGGVIERPKRLLRMGQAFVRLEEQVSAQEQKVTAGLFALEDTFGVPQAPAGQAYDGLLRASRNAAIGSVPAAAQAIELQLREAYSEGGKLAADAKRILEELARLGPVQQRLLQEVEALLEGVGDGSLEQASLRARRERLLETAREAREISGNCLALYQNAWPMALDASVEQLSDRQARLWPLLLFALTSIAAAGAIVWREANKQRLSSAAIEDGVRNAGNALESAVAERDQLRQAERRGSLELALLRLEQLSLTESLRSILVISDTSLVMRLANTSAKRDLGLDDGSTGLPLATLAPLAPLIKGLGGMPALERLLTEGRPLEVAELEVAPKWFSVRVTPYVDEAGKVRGLFFLADDITQAIETRSRLMQTERLAAMGRVSAQVTHEIRNPLSAIALNADLLADEIEDLTGDTTEAKHLLKAIAREVERLTEVTGEYLRLSRLRPPSMHPEALSTLVRELTDFLAEDLRRRHISLDLALLEPSPQVVADAAQLRQALLNIFKNSMESMPDGGQLKVTTQRQNGHAILEVRDNGVGIPEHILQRIFDPFYTTKEGGSGLGLPITQQIVAEHGGEVSAESETGKGTCVRVALPAAR